MSCPSPGPCSPFVSELELCCITTGGTFKDPCLLDGNPVPQVIVDNALKAASELMWAYTGRQYGTCTVTIRPCKSDKNCNPCPGGGEIPFFDFGSFGYGGGFPWYPQLTQQGWINVRPCGCNNSCGCAALCEQELPYPACCVKEVKINGVSLAPALFRIDDFRKLVRISGDMFVQSLSNENPTPSSGAPTSPGTGFVLTGPSSLTGMVSDGALVPTYSWDGISGTLLLTYASPTAISGFSGALTQANDFRVNFSAPGFTLDGAVGDALAVQLGFAPGSSIPAGATASFVVGSTTVTFTATGPSNELVVGGATGTFISREADFDGLDAGFTLLFNPPLSNSLLLTVLSIENAPVGITNTQINPATVTPPNVPVIPVIGPGASANGLGVQMLNDAPDQYDVQLGACRRGVTFDLVYGPGVSGSIDLFGLAGGQWDFSVISGNPLTVSKSGQTLTVGSPQDAGSNVVIRIRLLDPGCITDFIIQKHLSGQPLFLKQVAWVNEATTNNDSCWPECQDLSVDDNQDNTYSITVTYGREVPELIKLATGALACEFIKACAGQPCALPQRLTSLSRQGVTVGFLDPQSFFGQGLTGIYLVDLAVKTFNPKGLQKQAYAYSPDVQHRWDVVTGRDC